MKNLIEYIAKQLVDKPEEVEVTEVLGEQTSVIELRVAKDDIGKVIGKQGRTARAMRTILSAASTKLRKRSVLEIIESAAAPVRFYPTKARERGRSAFGLGSGIDLDPRRGFLRAARRPVSRSVRRWRPAPGSTRAIRSRKP